MTCRRPDCPECARRRGLLIALVLIALVLLLVCLSWLHAA